MEQDLICAYFVQLSLACVPIAHARVVHRDLGSYGLRATRRQMVKGLSSSIGIGICLGVVSSSASTIRTIGWVFLICVLAPICEEFFFRGFLQTHLMDRIRGHRTFLRFSLSHGLILTATVFGAAHLLDVFLLDLSPPNASVNATFTVFLGLVIGYVYQESRSILTPILMHASMNGLSLIGL